MNEGNNPVEVFISDNEYFFIDDVTFFDDAPPLSNIMQPNDMDEHEILVDQQPTKRSLFIPKGITVCWHDNTQVKLCEMISNDIKNNIDICKVKVLGPNDILTLPQSSVEPVCAPDPSSIPKDISDLDTEIL